MLKENDTFIVVGVDYTSEGIGLAKVEGFPLFINNLIIGEEAEVKVTKVLRNYGLAKIIRFTEKSADRIEPLIPEMIHLGGCQFCQLNYDAEVRFKLSKVNRALSVIGGLDYTVSKIHPAPTASFYRNKTTLPLVQKKNGEVVSGLYRFNTHELVIMPLSEYDDERVLAIMNNIKRLITKHNISVYDEEINQGDIKKVMIRTSYYLNEVMVVLITKNDKTPNLDAFCRDLVSETPLVTTIVHNINSRKTNVNLGEKEVVLYGDGVIHDKLHDLTFTISSKSFFQVNTPQAEKLYARAIEMARLTKDDVVLDAYSGIGTITLLAAKVAKHVSGVEIVSEAVKDAKLNALNNNLKNVRFYEDDAGDYLVKNKDIQKVDVVFVDPPRKGLSEKFINTLLKVKPERLIYISCDPATLSRDLKILTSIYDITDFEALDMFPRTAHVESITSLSLK